MNSNDNERRATLQRSAEHAFTQLYVAVDEMDRRRKRAVATAHRISPWAILAVSSAVLLWLTRRRRPPRVASGVVVRFGGSRPRTWDLVLTLLLTRALQQGLAKRALDSRQQFRPIPAASV